MRTRRKQALKLLAIATPMLAYGAYAFELGGAASTAEAIITSVTAALGIFGVVSGLVMFFTKNSLGMVETKPMVERVETKPEVVQEEEPQLKMPS